MVVGECQTTNKNEYDPEEDEKEAPPELDEGDIQLLLDAARSSPTRAGAPSADAGGPLFAADASSRRA